MVDVAGVGLDVTQRAAHSGDVATDNFQVPISRRHIEAIGAQPFQQSEQGAAFIFTQEVADDCRFMLPVRRQAVVRPLACGDKLAFMNCLLQLVDQGRQVSGSGQITKRVVAIDKRLPEQQPG
ncbi:hypothetical protein I5M74_14990 [Serratia marcescens]|nr:hypothetical protein [Serratia marcescens]